MTQRKKSQISHFFFPLRITRVIRCALYFETPYLSRGCQVSIDIYHDYNYAYVDADTWGMHLYDQWFIGDEEAHYVYEVHDSGYQYLWIEDLDPSSIVHINYGC